MVVLVVVEVGVLGGAQGSGLELVQRVEGQVVEDGVGEAKLVVVGGGGHGWWGGSMPYHMRALVVVLGVLGETVA
jgi:hypothetical protein